MAKAFGKVNGTSLLMALFLVLISFQGAAAESRKVIENTYRAYNTAVASGKSSEIIAAGEEFLAMVDVGILGGLGKVGRRFGERPIGTTVESICMLGAGAYIALPVVFLNFLERGGKSEHELFANTNNTGLDILLTKWEQRGFWVQMANAYYEKKNWEKASAAYEQAIELDETFRLTLAREDRRIGYYSNYDILLERLIASLFALNRLEDALAYIELAKAKTLRENFLSSGVKRVEKQSIRKVLLAKAQVETTLQKTTLPKEELETTKRSIEVIRKQTSSGSTGKTTFLLKNIVNSGFNQDVLSSLAPGVVTISYYVAEKAIYGLVLRDKEIISSFSKPMTRETLARLIEHFNRSARKNDRQAIQASGRELYNLLLGNLDLQLGAETLLIAPHSILHNLPFGALYGPKGFLVESHPVGYVYSISFLDLLSKRHGGLPVRRSALTGLVMGNPQNRSYPMPALPGAEHEASNVADILAGTTHSQSLYLYQRGEASEQRLKQGIQRVNLLHLATHAKFDKENAEQSFILLADGNGQDGLLHVEELYDLNMEQDLEIVVLSSCESGAAQLKPGDDPFGFSRAWFYLGAKRILSTYWPIDDRSTGQLMGSFYRHFISAGENPHKALQLAQKEQIAAGGVAWIPFKIEGMLE